MVTVDITRNLYFAGSVPWSRKQGLNIRHKPHQTSMVLKAWQDEFKAAAMSKRGTYGRQPGKPPNIALAIGDALRGRRSPGRRVAPQAQERQF